MKLSVMIISTIVIILDCGFISLDFPIKRRFSTDREFTPPRRINVMEISIQSVVHDSPTSTIFSIDFQVIQKRKLQIY